MKQSNQYPKERRAHHRFVSNVHIISREDGAFHFALIQDLAHGGAFIESKKIPPMHSSFTFTLATGKVKARIDSKVVRHAFCPKSMRAIGFAVAFEEPQAEAKFVRDDLLLYAMTKTYLEVWDQPKDVYQVSA